MKGQDSIEIALRAVRVARAALNITHNNSLSTVKLGVLETMGELRELNEAVDRMQSDEIASIKGGTK